MICMLVTVLRVRRQVSVAVSPPASTIFMLPCTPIPGGGRRVPCCIFLKQLVDGEANMASGFEHELSILGNGTLKVDRLADLRISGPLPRFAASVQPYAALMRASSRFISLAPSAHTFKIITIVFVKPDGDRDKMYSINHISSISAAEVSAVPTPPSCGTPSSKCTRSASMSVSALKRCTATELNSKMR